MRMNKKKEIVPKLRFPEFMNEDEWKNKRIEQLLTIGNGCDYKHLSKGDIPVYGSGGYMCSVDDFLYDGDSVCIGRKGTIDQPIFLRGKFWTVDTLFYTHSYKNCIPKFIYNTFQRVNWLKYNEAGGVPSLSKTTINKINVYIPKISEQQKIAACLSSIDELIDTECEKLKALEKYKKGLMQKLFPTEGKTLPEWRFSEFKNCGDWEQTTLTKVAFYENGKAHENYIEEYGKYIVVNSKFIATDGEVKKYSNTANLLAKRGDILMVLSDVPNGRALAKCYFVDENDKYTVNQRICRLRSHDIDSLFLFYHMNRNKYFLDFDDGVKQTNLKKSDVLACPLLKPKEKREQQKIADCLSEIDTIITEQFKKIERLETHKKGLLQGLFPSLEEADV
jgi:type I restriction enzyme S subunit